MTNLKDKISNAGKSFFVNPIMEMNLFKKSNWKNLFNNPISNNIIVYILLILIGLLSYKTYNLSDHYFTNNELRDSISSKFNTTRLNIIETQTEQNEINIFYDTIKTIDVKLKNNSSIALKEIQKPIKYEIQKSEKETFELGDIGDFIGGYFGFWLGIIGALLTFLAFFIQFKANSDVQKQFRIQQFETQFHKMIDVYLNNKDKFSIIGYKNPNNKSISLEKNSKKDISIQLKEILEEKKKHLKQEKNKEMKLSSFFSINNISHYQNSDNNSSFIEYTTTGHIVFQKFLVELKVVYRVFMEAYKIQNPKKKESEIKEEVKKEIFIEAYKLFMHGLNKYRKDSTTKEIRSSAIINNDLIKTSINILDTIKDIHKYSGTKIFKNFYYIEEEAKSLWVKLNYTPFQGYLHFLPQYYRNLYSIVKFVVNENEDIGLNDEQKLNYLRILRSTMSEYEQTMLFYNWYSKFGENWQDSKNKFFSEYKMIHNLKKITLIDDSIFIYEILNIPLEKREKFFENFNQ